VSVAIPAELARQIQATLAVTNNFAFDALRGNLRRKPRAVRADLRYSARVREGFSRGYQLAVNFNHPVLDVDHVIVGFLTTPDCQQYFADAGLDASKTFSECIKRLTNSPILGRRLTAEFLPMQQGVANWHDVALLLARRRPEENDAVDVVDLFDGLLHPAHMLVSGEIDKLEVDLEKLDEVKARLILAAPDKRPRTLRDIMSHGFGSLAVQIEDRTKKILEQVKSTESQIAARLGVSAADTECGRSLYAQSSEIHRDVEETHAAVIKADERNGGWHGATHLMLAVVDAIRHPEPGTAIPKLAPETIGQRVAFIDSTTKQIERDVRPFSSVATAAALSVGALVGIVAGWWLRYNPIL